MGRASCALMEVGLNEELNLDTTPPEASSTVLWDRIKSAISNLYPEDMVTNGTAIVYNYDLNWKKSDMTRRLDEALRLTEQSLQRAVQHQISFQWLHEDVLAEHITLEKHCDRSSMIKDLQEVIKEMRQYEKSVVDLVGKIEQTEVSILKRLQWSIGANPRIKPVNQVRD